MDNSTRSTFQLVEGEIIVVPDNFKTDVSENEEAFPATPRIAEAWREADNPACHFELNPDIADTAKKIGLFVPENVKAGDQLRIRWVEGNCACAIPA